MLYNQEQIRRIINNAVTTAGIDSTVVNGRPVGVLDEYRDFTQYGETLLQPNVANTFINSLYNQFIYNATRENFFTSPFDRFRERREGVGYGEYEAEVQPILPVPYDMKAFDRILDFWETPVVTQYYYINRRDTFPQTIVKEMLKDAFKSYDDFDNFLAKLIMAPRKGNIIIETNAVKQVINLNVASGAVKTKTYAFSNTEDSYKQLAADIVGTAMAMTAEPSNQFNNFAAIQGSDGKEVWTQSDRRDLVLMGTTDVLAKIRTYVLAFAMHNEEIDFDFTFLPVNDFDYASYDGETRTFGEKNASPIKLILSDGGWLKLEDNLDEEFSNTNAMTMGVQRALQVQQTIGIRAYRNAMVWLDENIVDVEASATLVGDTLVYYPNNDIEIEDVNFSLIPFDGKNIDTSTAVGNKIKLVKAEKGYIGDVQTDVTADFNYATYLVFSIVKSASLPEEVRPSTPSEFCLNVTLSNIPVDTDTSNYYTLTFDFLGNRFVIVLPTQTE